VHIVTLQRQALATRRLHGVSAAHLQSYLDELCYRLKRRDQRLDQRLDLLRRILKRCALHTPPATYSELIAA
jgi:hypothetical protein